MTVQRDFQCQSLNNNNNNNISLFCEDNILSIAYQTYGPLQVKSIQLFTKAIYKKIKSSLQHTFYCQGQND